MKSTVMNIFLASIFFIFSFNVNANTEEDEETDGYSNYDEYDEYDEYEEYEEYPEYKWYEGFEGYEKYLGKKYEEGREFFHLKGNGKYYSPYDDRRNTTDVVIFFSFASEESYELLVKKHLIKYLKSLNFRVILYHVDFYSHLDDYLSKLWLNADMNDMQDALFYKFFRAMHYGITPNSESDVRRAFNQAGVPDNIFLDYFYPINFNVHVRELRRKRLITDLNVAKVPSIYLKESFLINSDVVSNTDDYNLIDYSFLIEHVLHIPQVYK